LENFYDGFENTLQFILINRDSQYLSEAKATLEGKLNSMYTYLATYLEKLGKILLSK
jgi:hypothetical protein